MESTISTQTISLDIPKTDLSFLRKLARSMGWTEIKTKSKKGSYQHAIEDIKNGRVTKYDSLDDLKKELGL
ncbi:MAG: hypothetical protein MJZ13_01260 [Bacteroidales bacterium]|nr:hypothetical protein [Bacteroidales bacterium]